ncbi:Dyp-type peroxidase family [Sinobacterium caligoides]|uniref:Dyp-type peroxidase family n=1 Tax=Sinobacterium caligoides TaxID=933926 RepID=A0A3N2DGX6_9GAMM|nr:Dyp-type peroxidase [Sinobacterium caligoides]ROR99009.1 Dyp-type peroxidase family [Sinobacterium caligoides]
MNDLVREKAVDQIQQPQPLNLDFSQPGIPYFPASAHFVTIYLKDKDCFEVWQGLCQTLQTLCDSATAETVCLRGVSFDLWLQWCDNHSMPIPSGITSTDKLNQSPFAHTGGDLWFHIKGENNQACEIIRDEILLVLAPLIDRHIETPAHKRHQGKVIGGRFRDAMINPVDRVNLSERSIVGDEDSFYKGSAYVIQQKFKHNWSRLDDMTMVEKENMIGRNHNDAVLPTHDDRSHIKCVRQLSGERVTQRILRQAIPYGEVDSGKGREAGIYFAAYTNAAEVYDELIDNIVGPEPGFIKDKLLNNTHSESGNFWFIPQAELAGLKPVQREPETVPINEYYQERSQNGLMYYNNRDFLNQAQRNNGSGVDAISDRIMALLGQTFSRWNDTWSKKSLMPSLGHLQDYLKETRWQAYRDYGDSDSAALRKGLAIKISLSDVLQRQNYIDNAGLFTITANEIIVGNMPPLTLGSGSQVMEYLNPQEKIEHFFGMLNEYSATGHNIPNYRKVLKLGVPGLLKEANNGLENARDDQRDFYQSTVWALEGLQNFIKNYATLASQLAEQTGKTDRQLYDNYRQIAERMQRLAHAKPEGLLDCLQLIFIINCSLHQTGEPMSIGRLDQYLIAPLEADLASGVLTQAQAQEAIDAFWLKMDETVLYNRQHMQDYLTYGTGAVFYSGGNFPQGSALNQWVQQVTVGGYLPTDDEQGLDGCNLVTLMCLRAARRLPLNAPCLSLRVHKGMDSPLHKEIIAEASKAILAGGAHPVLLNDDKLCEGLAESGPLTRSDARDYVCDGCYEPIIGGKSEWAFSYVPILPVVGMAMNQGATIAGAGWVHLRGMKTGWNSPPAEDIHSFDEFMTIFYTQYKWLISGFFNTLMNNYGALWNVCPSPLFSAMTDGCMESGRDMSNGGAEYHIVAPMMCGITDAINSLYVIKQLVFNPDTAVTTLPELLQALYNNWGNTMQEPFQNSFAGEARSEDRAARYKDLRNHALQVAKFGEATSEELKQFADEVVGHCVSIIRDSIETPLPSVKKAYDAIIEKYSTPERKFAFTVTPGVGTFEDNVGLGLTMGASPDGRLIGDPVADDFCAAPSPSDQPPKTQAHDIFTCLNDWNIDAINIGLSNAAPVDINIREDFGTENMEEVIRQFANSQLGSNLLTVTTANPETFAQAQIFPEKYDLVRVRQGGWSEFYMAMFPDHQKYISRRPYYSAKNK